jgi:hypothetical protein
MTSEPKSKKKKKSAEVAQQEAHAVQAVSDF